MPGVAIVVVVVFLVVLGIFIGRGSATPRGTVGANEPSDDCGTLCSQWDQRRTERCNAEKDEASARAVVRSLEAQLAIFVATAAALTAAAFAALSNPFTAIAAIGLFVAAGVAAAAALVVTGELVSANEDVMQKARLASTARARESEARALILARCSPDVSNQCLSRPGPC